MEFLYMDDAPKMEYRTAALAENMPPGAPGSSFSFNLADTFGCGEQI